MDYQVKEEIREVLEELMESYSVDRLQRLKTILSSLKKTLSNFLQNNML